MKPAEQLQFSPLGGCIDCLKKSEIIGNSTFWSSFTMYEPSLAKTLAINYLLLTPDSS